MKYHALFVIFEKAANLQLSSAAIIRGALRVKICSKPLSLWRLKRVGACA